MLSQLSYTPVVYGLKSQASGFRVNLNTGIVEFLAIIARQYAAQQFNDGERE